MKKKKLKRLKQLLKQEDKKGVTLSETVEGFELVEEMYKPLLDLYNSPEGKQLIIDGICNAAKLRKGGE